MGIIKAVFGSVNGSSFSNVTVTTGSVTIKNEGNETTGTIGGFAGIISSSSINNLTFNKSIMIEADMTGIAKPNTGSFVGVISSSTNIKNLKMTGEYKTQITGAPNVAISKSNYEGNNYGVIAGAMNNNCRIENCNIISPSDDDYVSFNIAGRSGESNQVFNAGIVGSLYNGGTIKGLKHFAEISGIHITKMLLNEAADNQATINFGSVGYVGSGSNNIENLINEANIVIENNGSTTGIINAGAIVGCVGGSLTIDKTINVGELSFDANIANKVYLGAFVGRNNGTMESRSWFHFSIL